MYIYIGQYYKNIISNDTKPKIKKKKKNVFLYFCLSTGTDSGNEGSAKTSGSNSSTPVMSSNCSIRTRASTGVISGSINKTDIKSEGCPSPSSDTCSSRSGKSMLLFYLFIVEHFQNSYVTLLLLTS